MVVNFTEKHDNVVAILEMVVAVIVVIVAVVVAGVVILEVHRSSDGSGSRSTGISISRNGDDGSNLVDVLVVGLIVVVIYT